MELEIRGATTEINNYMTEYAMKILENTADMYGCSCEIKLMGAAEAMCSDRSLADRVASVCQDKLGFTYADIHHSGGSEDCSYMMNRVQQGGGQAVFFRTLTDISGVSHGVYYDMGEEVLANAVTIFCAMTADILG